MKPLLLFSTLMAISLAACNPGSPEQRAPAAALQPAPASTASTLAPAVNHAPTAMTPTATAAAAIDPAKQAEVDARIDKILGDHTAYRGVLERLQAAVKHDDRSGVAALVRYPLEARTQTDKLQIDNAEAFVAHYTDIMTPAVAKAITGQRYADLFVSQNGVMLGSGEVWINGICHDPACVDVDVKVVTFQHAG